MIVCLSLLSSPAFACIPGIGWSPFQEDAFEAEPLVLPTDPGGYSQVIPAPIVTDVSSTRIKSAIRNTSCSDSGGVFLEFEVPDGHPVPVQTYAVFFRVVEWNGPLVMVPSLPMEQWRKDVNTRIDLHWLDRGVTWYKTIDIVVDIHFLTGRDQIGPPTRFHIYVEPDTVLLSDKLDKSAER
ncbi:MAG: hypothetical protein AAF220_10100 [Pseudomonadota bacterium]